jgi:hypothetical protein
MSYSEFHDLGVLAYYSPIAVVVLFLLVVLKEKMVGR